MSTESLLTEKNPMRLVILPIDLAVLEKLLCLPEGCQIVDAHYDHTYRQIRLLLTGERFPEVQTDNALPHARLSVQVETLPDQDPAYRKITTEVRL